MEEILELLNAGQYLKLRQMIVNYNVADIAAYMEKMEKEEVLKLFRILPKSCSTVSVSFRSTYSTVIMLPAESSG